MKKVNKTAKSIKPTIDNFNKLVKLADSGDSIKKMFTSVDVATLKNFLNKSGYFARHFYLCRFMDQQTAYEATEDEYQKIAKEYKFDKKTMYTSYETFRTGKSNFYANKNNR